MGRPGSALFTCIFLDFRYWPLLMAGFKGCMGRVIVAANCAIIANATLSSYTERRTLILVVVLAFSGQWISERAHLCGVTTLNLMSCIEKSRLAAL